jgi:drug/metabolite transporter (DMT)-like permease
LDHSTNPTNIANRGAPSAIAIWAALLILYVVWGSTYLGIAYAIDTIPPFIMGAIRFIIAGLLLVVIVAIRDRGRIAAPTRREWRDSVIVGSLLMLGGMGLVAWGELTVPTGIAALLIALLPLWIAVFGWIFFGERLPRLVVAGIALGLVGVAVLVSPGTGAANIDPAGLVALLISPVCWALGSLYAARSARLPGPPLFATGLQMLTGGVALGVAGLATGEVFRFDVTAVSTQSILAIGYLVVIGSLVGFTAYAWLLRVAPLSKIATYAYVNPVVAFILGAVLANEVITPRIVLAATIIIVAVALIVTARGQASRAEVRRADAAAVAANEAEAA